MKRIISYNVNGIRAAINKGWLDWLKACNPDIVCLQEIKAHPDQLDLDLFKNLEYHTYWFPANKKGYSGVAILSKTIPDHIEYGCGISSYDEEGRVLRADYGDTSVMSIYMPSGTSGDLRQAFKIQWLNDFKNYIDDLKKTKPNLIIGGDYNICHQSIDIHDPIRNAKSSGFLPEEREWIDSFMNSGFIDCFRHFNREPHHYTWWSLRTNARARNLGWRIDYQLASESLKDKLRKCLILPEAKHSDHCPVLLEIEF